MTTHHRFPVTSNGPAALSRRDALKAGAAVLAALFSLGHITPALADELARLAQDQPMTSPKLASILQAERSQWNALLAEVGLDRMDVPGVEGEWSVKQLVAHLTWYERGVVESAQQIVSTRKFRRRRPEGVSLDENNDWIADESRSRPAAEVLAKADEVFSQLLAVVTACPQDILNDPHVLGLPEDMVPWMGVANNSYAHYRTRAGAPRLAGAHITGWSNGTVAHPLPFHAGVPGAETGLRRSATPARSQCGRDRTIIPRHALP